MPRRLHLLLLAVLLLLASAHAFAAPAPGDYVRDLPFGGLPRRYLLHVPSGYDGASPLPLVVDLHGYGSNLFQQRGLSGMADVADAEHFLVAYPDGWDNAWNAKLCCGNADIDDVAFIRAV